MKTETSPVAFLVLVSMLACSNDRSPEAIGPGHPLSGLSPAERSRFEIGGQLFNKVYTVDEGVGPFLNENQCSACHTDPVAGGTGEQLVVRFAAVEGSVCDPLEEMGGSNARTRTTPPLAAHGISREELPPASNRTGRFKVPFLFGLGLAEAVPDTTLAALEDPDDRDGDGISGRAPRLPDGRMGRFGSKSEFASLRDFTVGALRAEMGLTSPDVPNELVRPGLALPPDADPASDPEVDAETVDLLTDHVAFLAPISPAVPGDPESAAEVESGRRLFGELGCAACHVPALHTGPHPIAALGDRSAPLYSDFLLHDLGDALADVCGADAEAAELRTAPLAGLRFRSVYLHDGRAGSLHEAIVLHGGEAAGARDRFLALDPLTQFVLIRFLESL